MSFSLYDPVKVVVRHSSSSAVYSQSQDGRIFIGNGLEIDRDVIAHELGHGLIDAHKGVFGSSGLGGSASSQTAALEESLADVIAVLAEYKRTNNEFGQSTWRLFDISDPFDFRDLSDPENSEPSNHLVHMDQYSETSSRHRRSTINSYAFYLMAKGGYNFYNGDTAFITPIGLFLASNVFHAALQLTDRGDDFSQFRGNMLAIAASNAFLTKTIRDAYCSVGIGCPAPSSPPLISAVFMFCGEPNGTAWWDFSMSTGSLPAENWFIEQSWNNGATWTKIYDDENDQVNCPGDNLDLRVRYLPQVVFLPSEYAYITLFRHCPSGSGPGDNGYYRPAPFSPILPIDDETGIVVPIVPPAEIVGP